MAQVKTHLNLAAVRESPPLLDVRQVSEEVGVGSTLDKATTCIKGSVPWNVREGSECDAFASSSARLSLDCFYEPAPMSTARRTVALDDPPRDSEDVGEPKGLRTRLVTRYEDEARQS